MKSLSPRPAAGWRLGHRVRREDRRSTMATYQLNVNGAHREVTVDPSTPLLWVLREDLKMTGTNTAVASARVGPAPCTWPELPRGPACSRYRSSGSDLL